MEDLPVVWGYNYPARKDDVPGYNKKALQLSLQGFQKIWQLPTLPHCVAVPTAMRDLTSLLGMGRGVHPRQNHHKKIICL
jgi:hypothetical protein